MNKKTIICLTIIFLLIFSTIGSSQIQKIVLEISKNQLPNNSEKPHPWPKFRHDLKNTGNTNYTGPESPTLFWKYKTDNGIISSAAIKNDGTIYFGSGWNLSAIKKGSIYAIHSNGTLKWKYTINKGFSSSPAIGPDSTIYLSGLDGSLYAFIDENTEALLEWKKPLKFFFNLCSPAVDSEGIIHIGSPSYDYFQIYPNSITKYRYKTDWCIISSPAINEQGTTYIGSKDHNLYAFNSEPATLKWKFPTGTFYDGHLVDSSPAIGYDGTIYFGTDPYGAFEQDPIITETNIWAVNPD